MLNRKQFREHWNKVRPGLGDEDSGLWLPEQHHGKKSRWFVSVRPIPAQDEDLYDFWQWCYKNCRGSIMCYSASVTEEWWGFSHRADVAWWMLKWA